MVGVPMASNPLLAERSAGLRLPPAAEPRRSRLRRLDSIPTGRLVTGVTFPFGLGGPSGNTLRASSLSSTCTCTCTLTECTAMLIVHA